MNLSGRPLGQFGQEANHLGNLVRSDSFAHEILEVKSSHRMRTRQRREGPDCLAGYGIGNTDNTERPEKFLLQSDRHGVTAGQAGPERPKRKLCGLRVVDQRLEHDWKSCDPGALMLLDRAKDEIRIESWEDHELSSCPDSSNHLS